MSKGNAIHWNTNQKQLRSILGKKATLFESIKLCLQQHAMVHASVVSQWEQATFEDELWKNLDETRFRTFVNHDHGTIARNMYHATRIEDICMNLLIKEDQQVFNNNWKERLNITITDTGNAMTEEEVIALSNSINMQELKNYRIAVGKKTQELIRSLSFTDLKQKPSAQQLNAVLAQGAVLDVEGANWLIGFWKRKTVAGLLLMPATRHNLVHINQSKRIKNKISNNHI